MMVLFQYAAGCNKFSTTQAHAKSARRRDLFSHASRLALRSTLGISAATGIMLIAPSQAWAACVVGGVTVQCDTTSTTNTTFPANAPADRDYQA